MSAPRFCSNTFCFAISNKNKTDMRHAYLYTSCGQLILRNKFCYQTPRPASGRQGQIFLPLLDFFLTPVKRALADTQTRLWVHVPVHLCHSPALFSTPALLISVYLLCIAPIASLPLSSWLECQTSGQSWRKPLEAEASRHTSTSMFSEPHIHKSAKGKKGFILTLQKLRVNN